MAELALVRNGNGCGTGAAGAERVRNGCGTVRNGCGTPADLRRGVLWFVQRGLPRSSPKNAAAPLYDHPSAVATIGGGVWRRVWRLEHTTDKLPHKPE